jgi:hypothetical protein
MSSPSRRHASNLTLEVFCRFVIFEISVEVGGKAVNEVGLTVGSEQHNMVHHLGQSAGASIAVGLCMVSTDGT